MKSKGGRGIQTQRIVEKMDLAQDSGRKLLQAIPMKGSETSHTCF